MVRTWATKPIVGLPPLWVAGSHCYDEFRRLQKRGKAWDVAGGCETKWREFCAAVDAAAVASGARISAWYTEAPRVRCGDA